MGRRSNSIIKKHEKVDEQKQKKESESLTKTSTSKCEVGKKIEHKLKEQVKSYAGIVLNVHRVTNQVELLESLLA